MAENLLAVVELLGVVDRSSWRPRPPHHRHLKRDQIVFLDPQFVLTLARNPRTFGTNQGNWKRRFAPPVRAGVVTHEGFCNAPSSTRFSNQPSERSPIVFFNRLDLHHKSPDFGELSFKSGR